MLRVCQRNPRYFETEAGEVVYLAGSHNWANFKDFASDEVAMPPFDFERFLDFLASHEMNFFRLWNWDFPRSPMRMDVYATAMWRRSPFPWPRTGPGLANDGLPRFDLTKFDESYFARLRERVVAASRRGIYAAVMLFGGVEHFTARCGPTGFPLDGPNNVNGIACGSLRSQTIMSEALPVHEAYVRRVVDTVNDLDNVLYEIANEAGSHSIEWQLHLIEVIRRHQAGLPHQHPIGITDITDVPNRVLMASGADWMSPSGADGYGMPTDPPSATGAKVIVNDTDHAAFYPLLEKAGPAGQRAWVWKSFLRGCNVAFMDPYLMPWPGRNDTDGTRLDPYWDTMRLNIKYTRQFAARIDLAAMRPSGHLASTGYCLANPSGPGAAFLVYLPNASQPATIDLSTVAGKLRVEWFHPSTALSEQGGPVDGGATVSFESSGEEDAVLFLRREA